MSETDARGSVPLAADERHLGPPAPRRPRRTWPLRLTFLGVATLGWSGVRPVTWFNLSDGFFLAAIGLILFKTLQGSHRGIAPRSVRRSPPLLLQGALVLLAASAVSSFVSWNPGASIGETLRLAYLTLIWFWALRTVCPDFSSFLYLVKGWKVMVLLTAGSAFVGEIVGGERFVQNENRLVGLAEHPNALGAAISVGLPIVLFVVPPVPPGPARKRAQLLRYGLAAAGGVALLQSGSVSSAVAAVAGVGAAAGCDVVTASRRTVPGGTRDQLPLGPLVLAFVGFVGLAFVASTSNPVGQRLTELGQENSIANRASIDTREELNAFVLENFDDRLIVGVGLDEDSALRDLPSEIPEGLGIHNFYLALLHEAGLIAVIAVVAINLYAAYQAIVLASRLRNHLLRMTAVAMMGSLVAANVGAQFQPIGFVRYYWLPIGMITCLWALARTHSLAADPSTRPSVAA
jgi:hypothetical protein